MTTYLQYAFSIVYEMLVEEQASPIHIRVHYTKSISLNLKSYSPSVMVMVMGNASFCSSELNKIAGSNSLGGSQSQCLDH